jgi:flavin-dependent dehydrogenase
VTGFSESEVETKEGRFSAPLIVDCSGWRGVLVNGGDVTAPAGRAFSFGIEAKAQHVNDGLFFWLDSRVIPQGMAWLFPVSDGSLIGLGSYAGETKLAPRLRRFLEEFRARPTRYHGTYFPNDLRRATVERIFAVGDAAGQCLPLTAEGIRPALFFGQECGKIVQQILDGRFSHEQGLALYRKLVDRFGWAYRWLRRAQWLAAHCPSRWLGAMAVLANRPRLRAGWWPRYGRFGPLDSPAPTSPSCLPGGEGLGETWGPTGEEGLMGGRSV